MIIRDDRSFPHPVLAPFRDDVQPNTFEFSLKVTSDADYYYLDIEFKYDNETLTILVESGKAVHVIHLECKRNFYREIFPSRIRTQQVRVSASDLVGKVEVSGFIKAEQPIADYQIRGAHSDYGDATFDIRAGDILAAAQSRVFDAYVDYDPLRNISSIMTIRRSEDTVEGAMKLETSEDLLIVTLSQKDYDRYAGLKGDPSLGPLLANQVVVPALLEAVQEIRTMSEDQFDDEKSKRWFRSIDRKLADLGIEIRSPSTSTLEAVQTLLKLPLRRSLESLIQLNTLEA